MYNNVPSRFIPDNVETETLFPHPTFHYVHNNDDLNATHEFLDRGIEENGWGEDTAIVSLGTDEEISFNELSERVNRFAGGLRALGVEPGDRVVWRFGEVPEAIVTHLATWKIGGVVTSTALPENARELQFYLNDTEATTLVTMDERLGEVEKALPEVDYVENVIVSGRSDGDYRSFKSVMELAEPFEGHVETDPFDVASIMYTSGTTGNPKGCIHSHAAAVANADADAREGRDFGPEDVSFSPAPVGHGMGNVEKIKLPYRNGVTVVLARRPSPERMLEIVEEQGVTVMDALGAMVRMMINQNDLADYDLSSLRLLVSPVIDKELNRRWVEATGVPMNNALGMCPLTGIGLAPYRDSEKFAPDVSLGRPLTGYETKLVDIEDPDREVGRGEQGQIKLRGPSSITYWNNIHPGMPDKMEEDTHDGWSLLDDVFYQTEDGYLYHVARLGDMISSAGRQISGLEVEEVVSGHEAVDQVAVIGKPHEVRGEIIKAFIQLNPSFDESDDLKAEIQEYAKENMALYKYPREIEFMEEIPMSPQGKLQRQELRDQELKKEASPV
jgi:2-aminobenzoate-CoA ligase